MCPRRESLISLDFDELPPHSRKLRRYFEILMPSIHTRVHTSVGHLVLLMCVRTLRTDGTSHERMEFTILFEADLKSS